MVKTLDEIFLVKKPVIGMLHLDYLLGTSQYKGLDFVVQKAKKDIEALQEGGIDGILIENWRENSLGEFVATETAVSMTAVVMELVKNIKVPFGINVLNNDYRVAFSLAAESGASFVELDVIVDEVASDFSHSDAGKSNPFIIKVDLNDVKKYAKLVGVGGLPLFCFVQPKHYKMLEASKPIQESVGEAESFGVTGVLVTKATGVAPTLGLIGSAKVAAKSMAVGIGSGFSVENAVEFLKVADFAVVGSSIKIGGEVDNELEMSRVKNLMEVVNDFRHGG